MAAEWMAADTQADALRQMTLDNLTADPEFPPELIAMLRTANVESRSAEMLDNDMLA